MILISVGAIWLIFNQSRRQSVFRPITQIIYFILIFIKVTLCILIEGVIFPLLAGYFLELCSYHLFNGDFTVDEPENIFKKFPVASIFIHWIFGLMYMFNFSCFVSWLRGILRDGVLWFFRNPNDPNFDPLKEMIEVPILKQTKRIILSILLYASMIGLLVWGPIVACKNLFPSFLPFKFWNKEVNEIPLDLIVFHVLIPFTLDHFRPTKAIKWILKKWFLIVGSSLDLHSYLFFDANSEEDLNPNVNRERNLNQNIENEDSLIHAPPVSHIYYPSYFGWRISILITLGLSTLFLCNLSLITIPVITGRYVISYVFPSPISDIYAFATGIYFCWGIILLINIVAVNVISNEFSQLIRKTLFLYFYWN